MHQVAQKRTVGFHIVLRKGNDCFPDGVNALLEACTGCHGFIAERLDLSLCRV